MSDDIKDPNRPRTVLHYRCQDCGQTEYKRIAEQGDRKRKGWCKVCKQIIYPINEIKIVGKEREFKARKPPPMW
jgi:predicted SprT family Zn-dependent metalloprotease